MCRLSTIKNSQDNDIIVADIKRDYIANIMHACKLCPNIKKVILFGSSMEDRCKDTSDIDIAVFGDKTKAAMFKSKTYRAFINAVCNYGDWQDYDILYFKFDNPGNHSILKDISAGSILYERG